MLYRLIKIEINYSLQLIVVIYNFLNEFYNRMQTQNQELNTQLLDHYAGTQPYKVIKRF